MLYTAFSLNGPWEMAYSPEDFAGTENPWTEGFLIPEAVPGYWEDMTDQFSLAPFFGQLKVNREYGLQRYPIAGTAPDMALPNITGTFFYRRSFFCQDIREETRLFFAGVQNRVRLWLNDAYLGSHEGYCTPFSIAVPEALLKSGENVLVLAVSNSPLEGYGGEPVSGLTSRAANEYTGGITGDVELRVYHCPLKDAAVIVSEDCGKVEVSVQASAPVHFNWTVYDGAVPCKTGSGEGDFSFDTEGLACWSPENPRLYTLELNCGTGTLRKQFGVRRLTVDGVQLRLNGKPCYLRGACEHCYFPETVHPNHDSRFYRNVIRKLKELGFNFIRFHTFIPEEEYMQAADELGILLEVESPNNTSLAQWQDIVEFCRRHTSVVMYSCGNELLIDEPFLDHLHSCADVVHGKTDALFSPMSALRGVEYYWEPSNMGADYLEEPFAHSPSRIAYANSFSDLYNSYTHGLNSYNSLDVDAQKVDDWSRIYNRPRLSHEICIQGTYTDLSLEARYAGTRVGKTEMFSSLRTHLEQKGLLKNAPLYFRNSVQWQRRLRKHCFENVRLSRNLAGYDFLGPIDTHWHTFGYDVGMMNEFYELKPGETVRNVRMYNSPTVLLTDLGTNRNFFAGEPLSFGLYASHFGEEALTDARLNIRLTMEGKLLESRSCILPQIPLGEVSRLPDFRAVTPQLEKPAQLELYVTLECGDTYVENQWELYLFPRCQAAPGKLLVAQALTEEALTEALQAGKDVLLLGADPFVGTPLSFQMSLAGRTSGNLATVIADHPVLGDMPHEGFCGWQFRHLMQGGKAVCFENGDAPYDPLIEVVSSHKYALRQAALFEYRVFSGRLLVCGFHFDETDPAALWLKAQLMDYAQSDDFAPAHTLTQSQLAALIHGDIVKAAANTNRAFNPNDKAAVRRAK